MCASNRYTWRGDWLGLRLPHMPVIPSLPKHPLNHRYTSIAIIITYFELKCVFIQIHFIKFCLGNDRWIHCLHDVFMRNANWFCRSTSKTKTFASFGAQCYCPSRHSTDYFFFFAHLQRKSVLSEKTKLFLIFPSNRHLNLPKMHQWEQKSEWK